MNFKDTLFCLTAIIAKKIIIFTWKYPGIGK